MELICIQDKFAAKSFCLKKKLIVENAKTAWNLLNGLLTENFGNSGWKVNGKTTFRKFQPLIEEYVLR